GRRTSRLPRPSPALARWENPPHRAPSETLERQRNGLGASGDGLRHFEQKLLGLLPAKARVRNGNATLEPAAGLPVLPSGPQIALEQKAENPALAGAHL